jgi:SAM-dependent methyltransferase
VHASTIAIQGTGPAAAYAQFRAAVAQAQITHWLAGLDEAGHSTLIDISGPGTNAAELAVDSGHTVLRVVPQEAARPGAPEITANPGGQSRPADQRPRGRLRLIAGDASGLEFLADACADGVLAEDGTLSRNLAAEELVSEIARVLRPGGRVLACVDSLTLGMAALAQQSRWPHLVDLPHADVVLVPWPDGTITRCYGAEQLRELFTAGGFDVSWIRPRTVFAPRAVSYLLARDPHSFPRLLSAELRARADDSVGDQLIVSARRR